MRTIVLLSLLLLGACAQGPAPVSKPCGVIVDPLHDVRGMTAKMDRRIDLHNERGVAAGCWDRQGRLLGKT
jgi:hypothetical protein